MKRSNLKFLSETLPITRDLTPLFIFSLIIAFMMMCTSACGLLYQESLYPTPALVMDFLPTDAFNLIVGLPFLLISMRLAQKSQMIGLLIWPGALMYVLYVHIPYLVGVPFNVLFLPYLLIAVLSAYTLIGLVTSIDLDKVRRRLTGFVPVKTCAGILIGLGVFVALRQTAMIISALVNQSPAEALEIPAWIADFVLIPMLLVGGLQLWRRQGLGYVAGAGIFISYGILALSVIPFMINDALVTGEPIDWFGMGIILVMAALCFIPFRFFVIGARSNRRYDPEDYV